MSLHKNGVYLVVSSFFSLNLMLGFSLFFSSFSFSFYYFNGLIENKCHIFFFSPSY